MQVTSKTLPNHLRTILVDTGGAESATVLLLVGSGSRYENAKNSGIAHFFEHMAFKGSAKYPDSFTISSTIEGMGGVFNAFTSKDHTGYWIKGTADKVPLMLDVLADMVTASKLDQIEIDKEKGVIVEEMHMYEDMPQAKVSNIYDELLYGSHPLGMDIIGTQKTVKSFDRQDFVNYIHKLYDPDNAVLVIAGGIASTQKVIEHNIAQTFGKWKPAQKASKDYSYIQYVSTTSPKTNVEGQKSTVTSQDVIPDKRSAIRDLHRKSVFTKKTEQAHFILGYTTPYGFMDEEKYSLGLLAAILGGGMSSRLFMEIREKRGLCYYVNTSRDMYAETGSLVTSAGVRCDKDTVNEAIKLIIAEHHKLVDGNKIKKELQTELDRVKTMSKGRLLLSLEDSQSVAGMYGNKMLLEKKMANVDEAIEKMLSVTVENIIDQAQKIILPENLRLAIVGPFAQEDICI
ncbi:MAG: pitrilysin family protein [Candidatus Roizmanbacteria bacterium]